VYSPLYVVDLKHSDKQTEVSVLESELVVLGLRVILSAYMSNHMISTLCQAAHLVVLPLGEFNGVAPEPVAVYGVMIVVTVFRVKLLNYKK